MLKIKPDYPATFHMDGLLSVPTGVGCSYTGVKYKDPPFAMYASSGAAAQPLPTTIGKPETQITCASVGAVALPSPGAAEIVETQDMTQDMTQESSPSKTRTVFSENQRSELGRAFDDNKYLTRDEMQQLADLTKMTYEQVKIWVQNRRSQWKRTVTRAVILNEREKMRSRAKLRKAESIMGPIMMNKIITAAGLEFEPMNEDQLCPIIILEERE